MSGALPPVKISELPPYTGADNPDGTLPITIAGTTYGINTSKLGGSGGATPTLSQVIQVGDLDVRDISEDSDLIDSDAYQQLNINSGGLVFSIPTISQTSGEFIVGHRYEVITYITGDDISNIGGTNASSTTFTATGTTATDYTNGSTIVDLTASAIIPNNSTVRINNTIVQNPDTGLTISFGVGCIVSANGSILSGSTLVIPNGVKCFLNHLQDLSFTVTYEVGSISSGSSAVTSVNAQTGDVILNSDNIGDGTTYKQYSATEKTKLAGIASTYAPISTTPIILLNDNTTTSAVTGTTSNTILSSYLIPANTFASGDRLIVNFLALKSTAVGTATYRLYINTTNSIIGATQIATFANAIGSKFQLMERNLSFKSSTSLEVFSSTVGNAYDLGADTNLPSSITYDTTQAYYLITSVIPNNASDSFTQSRLSVTKFKSKTTF